MQFPLAKEPFDPVSVGVAGSQATAIAKDILPPGRRHQVPPRPGHRCRGTPRPLDVVTDWCPQAPGRALRIAGDQRFKVFAVVAPVERRLVRTSTAWKRPGEVHMSIDEILKRRAIPKRRCLAARGHSAPPRYVQDVTPSVGRT